MLKQLVSAFTSQATKPADTQEKKRRSDRRIVSTFASGNIRLQNGRYVTKADLDKQYERVARYDFRNERESR